MDKEEDKMKIKSYDLFYSTLVLSLLIILCSFILFVKLSEIPRRVCHTEEKIEFFEVSDTIIEFPFSTEIICEEGVDIVEYDILDQKTIYGFSYEVGKKCMKKTKEEICEIK